MCKSTCKGPTESLRRVLYVAAAASLVVAAAAANAQKVAVTRQGPWAVTLTTLPGGSKAHSINEIGEIVGEGLAPDGRTIRPIWLDGAQIGTFEGIAGNPYSWDSNRHAVGIHVVSSRVSCNHWWTPTASGQFDDCYGGAYDINEFSESAGSDRFTTPTVHRRVVTWKAGAIHRDLGLPPGAREAQGAGINDRGDVVGHLTDAATGRIEAFVHRDGQFTRLPSLPGPYASYAYDINNNGDILGTSNGGYPVVWKAGSTAPTPLALPSGRYPHSVWRINDSGDVVGTVSGTYPVFYTAVMWRDGQFIELGTLPTGTESYAYDISNAGVVVGTSTTGTPYGWHAVTWTVAPATGADLALSMTDAPDPVRRGARLDYTIVVRNDGPESSDGVTVTDTLPSAVSLLGVTTTQGSCAGSSIVTCSLGAMPSGATATVSISTRARVTGTVTNAASVIATTSDPFSANNTASATTTIIRR